MPVFGATGAIGRLAPQRLRRFSDVQPELYVMSRPGRGSGSVPQVLYTVPDGSPAGN
jgi:hypothetical protein